MDWKVNTLYQGDVLKMPWPVPNEVFQCCVTSPPYWGLRTYGTERWEGGNSECDHKPPDEAGKTQKPTDGQRTHAGRFAGSTCWKCGATRIDQQLGLEQTPEEYITKMVTVFREVRRVLRKDGTLFLNMGDSYNMRPASTGISFRRDRAKVLPKISKSKKIPRGHGRWGGGNVRCGSLKPKDLCGIPWRLALALQADGWWLRCDIVWAKPNPMPESVTDRPTKSHEYIFLLTKSARYFYDQDAVREPVAESTIGRGPVDFGGQKGRDYQPKETDPNYRGGSEQWGRTFDYATSCKRGRNLRSVWTFSTKPYPKAHFATFPPELPRRCILAGTSEKGACPECGSSWVRVTEKTMPPLRETKTQGPIGEHGLLGGHGFDDPIQTQTLGWRPTCSCHDGDYRTEYPKAHSARKRGQRDLTGDWWRRVRRRPGKDHWPVVPCVVLDPFCGSGTSMEVAIDLDRDFFGIDLNGDYLKNFAQPRIDRAIKRQKARLAQGVLALHVGTR